MVISAPAPDPVKPLRGGVITTYRHYKGKKLGPYYFRKWKVGKRIYKKYVKPEDVESVRAACQDSKQRRRETNRYVDNVDFLRSMNEKYDRGKQVTLEQEGYILRIHHEGMTITGRPPLRPRRVFGVPNFSNFFIDCFKRTHDYEMSRFLEAFNIHPNDVLEDLFPTRDEQMKKRQWNAVDAALRKRIFVANSLN